MSVISEGTPYHYQSFHGGGAIPFIAPELLDPPTFGLSTGRPTCPSDMYSFAMTAIEVLQHPFRTCESVLIRLILQLYTGKEPFCELSPLQVPLRVVPGNRPSRPELMSDDVWFVTQRCWDQELARRPNAEVVARAMGAVHRGLPCNAVVVILRSHHVITMKYDRRPALLFFFYLRSEPLHNSFP